MVSITKSIKYHKLVLILLLIFCQNSFFGQIKNVGLPFITNYTRNHYKAETQNWCIAQDNNGVMYFANNTGLLVFNGTDWEVYQLNNKSIVRSICVDGRRIYAGGFNEFGYFERDNFGVMHYTSLSGSMLANHKGFDEIWRIYKTNNGIVFQSYTNVFILKNNSLKILEPRSQFGFSYMVNDTVFVIDRGFGIYYINENRLSQYFADDKFFIDNEITFLYRKPNGRLIIGTTNNGIYYIANNKLTVWDTDINKQLIKNQIYTGQIIDNKQLAVGTVQDGVYIVDFDGKTTLHINRLHGLNNNTVLSLFYDKNKNIWLGLDNGIAMLEVSSPITLIDYSYNIETGYGVQFFNNNMYVATNQGLFTIPANKLNNHELNKAKFTKIDATLGQVWCLKIIDNKLFCGHNFGTFIIDGLIAHKISDKPGGWDYTKIPGNDTLVIGGNYRGLNLFKANGSNVGWTDIGYIKGFNESSKSIMFENSLELWVNHSVYGLYKLSFNPGYTNIYKKVLYNNTNGLPKLPYSLANIDNKVMILANDALYQYNKATDSFLVNNTYTNHLKQFKNITRVIETNQGDLWVFSETGIGVLRKQEDGVYVAITKPFYRIKNQYLKNSFENIYYYNNNTFIGSQAGLIHYSANIQKEYGQPFGTFFSSIRVKTNRGKNKPAEYINANLTQKNQTFGYSHNSIMFSFFAPFYESGTNIEYSYRLKGFDNQWSEWDITPFKEYTNLDFGKYDFEVKARNVFYNQSAPCTFSFTIKPPLYRSKLAYIIYIIMLISLSVANIIYFKHKIDKTRKIEQAKLVSAKKVFKQEVKISEQKIEQLEQEKMKSEMRLKNIELANSTMNIIQKNKLLNNIKKELAEVSGKAKNEQVKIDIKQLITKIDRDINNDQNFKVFDKYFDRVHQDFLNRLRDKHPLLTAKDLRLCAYLRLNLSTKEIAPLMNVSTRGLEISRYRLRKKLDIAHDVSLVDYIMGV